MSTASQPKTAKAADTTAAPAAKPEAGKSAAAASAAGATASKDTAKPDTAAAKPKETASAPTTDTAASASAGSAQDKTAGNTPAKSDTPQDKTAGSTPAKSDTSQNKDEAQSKDTPERSVAQTVHPVPPASAQQSQPARGNSFLPLVLGGIIAGVIGFAASEMDLLGTRGDDGTAELREKLGAQAQRIDTLENAELPEAPPAPEVDLSPLEESLAEIERRLSALEDRPIVAAPEGVDQEQADAYMAQLAELQSSVTAQRDEMQALIDGARAAEAASAEAARRADAQAALSKILDALQAGAPYSAPLEALEDAQVSVDPALAAPAEDGVATLATLQAEFADAARAALSEARATSSDGEGVGGFLKRSLGVRSVAPKEGTDPDAVLSRAEAAVQAGDLEAALAELDALPQAGREAMSAWLASAQTRTDARSAAADLSQSLTAD